MVRVITAPALGAPPIKSVMPTEKLDPATDVGVGSVVKLRADIDTKLPDSMNTLESPAESPASAIAILMVLLTPALTAAFTVRTVVKPSISVLRRVPVAGCGSPEVALLI